RPARIARCATARLVLVLVVTTMFFLPPSTIAAHDAELSPLRFSVTQGRVHNEFLRDGPVAVHLVLISGTAPRMVLAFPAGNSGAALWLDAGTGSLSWRQDVDLVALQGDTKTGSRRGVTAELVATADGPVTVRHAVLSNVRVIRDYGYTGKTPAEVMTAPEVDGNTVVWQRERLDGAPGYYLSVEVLAGTLAGGKDVIELR